jgi:hypothetical protein
MRRLEVADVYRGGDVLPAGALDVRAAAAAIRRERTAACGLAVGPVRPAAEGRQAVDIAIADDAGVDVVEHVFGGGPDLARSRAAKTAINLVRLRMLGREEPA